MRRLSGFLEQPHATLYPCVWGPDNMLLPQAKAAILNLFYETVAPSIPDIGQYVRFAVIGSGACFNWAEDGDIDIQVWVSDDSLVGQVRKIIATNLLGDTCADLGLATEDCAGLMEVQYYAKPGRGTAQENLDGQPYACYDIDTDTWLVEPFPLTPEFYGDLFQLVEPRAEEIAVEADALLAEYERDRRDYEYWSALDKVAEGFSDRVAMSQIIMEDSHAQAKAFFNQLMLMRGDAYKPGGQGIFDDRDAIWKLLEVWGIKDRLKELAHGKPGIVV